MARTDVHGRIDEVRRFNRFFTRLIGVVGDGVLDSPLSLAEVRLLFEIANRPEPVAAEIARDLGLDAGYVSRLLSGLRQRGLVESSRSASDGRRSVLRLTSEGSATFAALDARSHEQIAGLLGRLSEGDQARVVAAMGLIERHFGGTAPRERVEPFVLRPNEPGDLGWVVHRHGALYAREYGWDSRFEALVAKIVAEFVEQYDPARERCWIAERDGAIVGSVFLVRHEDDVAKLRMLYVEPEARGLGLGQRLVDECVRFARQAGYRKITLWTQSVLVAARRIYEATGFELVASQPSHSFGQDLVSETWELTLADAPTR
jgi:DNA-binding MarR family transcriptional regulator/GNAT superfamily N-acetyltransferase